MVETVSIEEHAAAEIAAAREAGVDPAALASTHLKMARAITAQLEGETGE